MSAENGLLQLLLAVREKREFETRALEISRKTPRKTERYYYIIRRAKTVTEILLKAHGDSILSLFRKALLSPEITTEQQALLKESFMQALRNSLSCRIAAEDQTNNPKLVRQSQFKGVITGLMYDFLGLLRVATNNGFTFKQSVRIAGKAFRMHPSSLITLLHSYPQIPREIITVAIAKHNNTYESLDLIVNTFNLLRADPRFTCFDESTLLGIIARNPRSSVEMVQKRLENIRRLHERELEKLNKDPSNNLEFWWNQLKERGMVRTALLKNYLTELDVSLIVEMIAAHRKSNFPGFEALLDRVSIAVANLCD